MVATSSGQGVRVLDTLQDGPVLRAVLDNPPANAIGPAELTSLKKLIQQLTDDAGDTRVLIIQGGSRFFCGGVNIKMIAENAGREDGTDVIAEFGAELQAVLAALESLPIPTVAAMRGSAVGGGLELGLACDLRVVGESSSYGLPETHLGLIPGGGGTQRLTEVAGRGTALRLILLGELVRGLEANQLGIAQWVCPNDEVDKFAFELASSLSEMAPLALQAAKRCVTASRGGEGFELEVLLTRTLLKEKDTNQRLQQFLAGNQHKK